MTYFKDQLLLKNKMLRVCQENSAVLTMESVMRREIYI
jgi:hypothetical protein